MLLQRLNKNDLPEIIAFNRRCFSPADRWSEADWAELLEDERALYYALLENGQIVGSIFLYDWQGERDFLKIMNLGVAPDRRGQGLACRLLQKAAEELKVAARCEVVQVIGSKFVLFRYQHNKDKRKIELEKDRKRSV